MVKKRIEILREAINKLIVSEPDNNMELLNKSRELDKLIVQATKIKTYANAVLGNDFKNEFEVMVDRILQFEKTYQVIRIVDPVRKKILDLKENKLSETNTICYDFWGREVPCENCVSVRAYNENDVFFKLEYDKENMCLMMAVPVSIQGKRLVVELLKYAAGYLHEGDGKPGDGLKVLSAVEHINQAAVRDEMTSLYNRRFINERLPVDLLKSSLRNEFLSIIFADLDLLKKLNDINKPNKHNDICRNSERNRILKVFAQELRNNLRSENDWAARFGEQEFLVCLSSTGIDDARTVADRIWKGIEQKEFIIGHERMHFKCQLEVHTVCDESNPSDAEQIIELVDRKLDQGETHGKAQGKTQDFVKK